MYRAFSLGPAFGMLVCVACSQEVTLTCRPTADSAALAARVSPYDSVTIIVGTERAKVCYGRPSARGRQVFGHLVPFDTLWRTGANEPTIVHVPFRAEIAGLTVEPGSYSLYTVPSRTRWEVVVNASTGQWGLTREERGARGTLFPNAYTDRVRRQEVGRAYVSHDTVPYVEQLTIGGSTTSDSTTNMRIEWETTRVTVPIRLLPTSRE